MLNDKKNNNKQKIKKESEERQLYNFTAKDIKEMKEQIKYFNDSMPEFENGKIRFRKNN